MESLWENPQYVRSLELEWAGHPETNQGHPAQIAKAIGPGWNQHDVKLLDVGCGTGRLWPYFNRTQYTGIDMSGEMVNRCQAKGISAQQASIYSIPFRAMSYDLVVSNVVLFHIGHAPEAIKELWRVTKNRLAFSCYWRWSFPKFWHDGPHPVWHENIGTGTGEWVVANEMPAWMIRRLVSRLRPARQRIVWLNRELKPRCHRVAICILDR